MKVSVPTFVRVPTSVFLLDKVEPDVDEGMADPEDDEIAVEASEEPDYDSEVQAPATPD